MKDYQENQLEDSSFTLDEVLKNIQEEKMLLLSKLKFPGANVGEATVYAF